MINRTASADELLAMIEEAVKHGGSSEMIDTLVSAWHYVRRTEGKTGTEEEP